MHKGKMPGRAMNTVGVDNRKRRVALTMTNGDPGWHMLRLGPSHYRALGSKRTTPPRVASKTATAAESRDNAPTG